MALYAMVTNAVGSTALTLVTAQITEVVTQLLTILSDLVANPFFAFLFACGFVRILMSLVKKAKKTAR